MDGSVDNPFDESDNDDEKLDYLPDLHLCNEDSNEKTLFKSPMEGSNNFESVMTVDDIASRLITDKFLLTALEFHMELMESGHELPRLRDFFSNPTNFERGRTVDSNKLTRTSSIQTFDSLDFARYSDDGERHESDRIAVLEFELRKAHEKINSLRTSLTKAAETDLLASNTNKTDMEHNALDDSLMPYEKRALNFLINEYLLKHNYKLTSVTFSEENDGQDFDDWDDVGINVSKPPDLIKLFREYGHYSIPLILKKDFGCMTSPPHNEQKDEHNENIQTLSEIQTLKRNIEILEKRLEVKVKENADLKAHFEDLKCNISGKVSTESSVDVCKSKSDDVQTSYIRGNDAENHDVASSKLETITHFNSPEICHLLSNTLTLKPFQKKLLEVINAKEEAHELPRPILKCMNSVVEVLGNILPRIVPNVLIAKRDELIPLLINAAALHFNATKRDELLGIIFNLIKRPNIEQRHSIKNGCIAFAQHVGPLQTEGELLPQCWEQIFHKYPERRLLVAETCGSLSQYVLEQTRSSLLLSMFDQMSTDKEEDVREAVTKSLAVVVSFLEKNDKYDQIINLLRRLMADPSDKVSSAAKSILLPVLAKWSLDLKCLEKFLNLIVMEPIEMSIYKVSNHFAVKDQKLFLNNMTNLHKLLPFIMAYLVTSCYSNNKPDNLASDAIDHVTKTQRLLSVLNDESSLCNISIIMSEYDLEALINHFYQTITQEWFALWNELDWLISELLQRLIDLSAKLEISQPSLHFLVAFFKDICMILSPSFSKSFVKPKFDKIIAIPSDENSLDRALMNGQSVLNRSIVPIFFAGVYPSTSEMNPFEVNESLTGFLCELLRSLAIHQSTLISLQASITELCSPSVANQSSHSQSLDAIIQVLWGFGIVHKNHLIRSATSQVIENLVSTCGLPTPIISGKIIPALVTLANDVEESVRNSSISPLGAILEYASISLDPCSTNVRAIIEKVQVQLQTFMEENQTPTESKQKSCIFMTHVGNLATLEIIKVLGRLGPKVETNLREEFVLPRLTALAVRNQLSHTGDIRVKQEVAVRLLDAFINISCCFLSHQVIQEVVLPGLKCLHHDIQMLAPDRVNIILSLMKEMEDKIEESGKLGNPRINISTNSKTQEYISILQGSNPQPILNMESAKHNFLSKIKDVKDKASNSHFTKMFNMSKK